MKILILGSGVYVTGKGMAPTGTILTSVIQSKGDSELDIHVVSRSESSREHTMNAAQNANDLLGTSVSVQFTATEGKAENWLADFIDEQQFDSAIVSLPDHLHHAYGKLCLSKGLHTLIVKPLTPTVAEAEDLIATAKSNNAYGAVEFHKRWDESNLYLKSKIADKSIGELLYFDVNYSQRLEVPRDHFKAWAHKSNIFQYLGVHYVDLIYYMTGAQPKKVSVYGTKKKLKSLGIDTWDSVHVSSVWGDADTSSNDFYAHYNLNWIDPKNTTAMSDQRISVVGTEGRIDCDQKNRGIYEVTNSKGAQSINPYFSSWIMDDEDKLQLNGYGFKSINVFITDVQNILSGTQTIEQLEQLRPSFTESLVSTKFIEAVNKALEQDTQDYIDL